MRILKFAPFYLFSLLPFAVIYGISDFAFLVLYYVVRYRRGVVLANLRDSFPEMQEHELHRIAARFYRHFCDVWLETNKALTISRRNLNKRFVVRNPELIREYAAQNRSVILYAAHIGNWEWMLALPLSLPRQVAAFYQPLSSGYFDEYMQLVRNRFGVLTIPSERGYRTLSERASGNLFTATIVIGDQSPPRTPDLYRTGFLHRNTAFLEGAERMAVRLKQAAVFAKITRTARSHYQMEFIPLYDGEEKVARGTLTSRYASLLEQSIRETPWMWLWSHRRWKHS